MGAACERFSAEAACQRRPEARNRVARGSWCGHNPGANMRPIPRAPLALLLLNGLFLALAIWGAVSAPPGEGGIGAGLAAIAALVTAGPLALAVLLWLIGLPRVAMAAAALPFLIVAGYQYLGVVAE